MAAQSDSQILRKRLYDQVDTMEEGLIPPCSIPADFQMGMGAETQAEWDQIPADTVIVKDVAAVAAGGDGFKKPPTLVKGKRKMVNGDVEKEKEKKVPAAAPTAATKKGAAAQTTKVAPLLSKPGVILPNMSTTTYTPPPTTQSSDSTGPPPTKKAKVTTSDADKAAKAQEKARREAEKVAEDLAKAQEKARKIAEKAAEDAEKERKRLQKEAEKQQKAAEKEAERQQKEAEKQQKAAEKAARDAEKAAKAAAKEEQRQRLEEASNKKERSQMRLGNFFTTTSKDDNRLGKPGLQSKLRTSLSPAPSASSEADPTIESTPGKKEISRYEAMFPPFFVKPDVTVAPISRFERDEEALAIITKNMDDYLSGQKPTPSLEKFDPRSRFRIALVKPRGRKFMPVKEIMEELEGNHKNPIDLTTESQHTQMKRTQELLASIPMKYLSFQEDVRPPYRGTYTKRPHGGIEKMARNPFRKDLPDLNYNYDSEAEWVEEDEDDAEDLKSELDDEEDADEDEEMAGFLDDEGDEIVHTARSGLHDLEPVSSGLCWEDKYKRNSNVKMMPYRMEFIINQNFKSIDPFSTSYWEKPKAMAPPTRVPLNTVSTNTPSVKSFFKGTSSSDEKPAPPTKAAKEKSTKATGTADQPSRPENMVSDADLVAFKDAVKDKTHAKVAMIALLHEQFPHYTQKIITESLTYLAHRGRKVGSPWQLYDS